MLNRHCSRTTVSMDENQQTHSKTLVGWRGEQMQARADWLS